MRLRTIAKAWNDAFFVPQSPVPICLYRIYFGLLVVAKLLLFLPDWLEWFGIHGWVTLDTMHRMEGGLRINLFDVLPQSDTWVWVFFWVALLAAASMTAGFMTRTSTFIVFLALVSIDERELYAMNSGDTFLRVACFWMMFAPTDAVFSVDRWIRVRRGREGTELAPRPVWPQRMIQFQMALVYFVTAWWKATGATWVDGTAVYYVHHLEQFQRFALPTWMDSPGLIRFETWFGLAEEFALGTLVWIKEFRYWVLALGVLLHLGLEYSMNVPLFQWIMLATFVLFIEPADLEKVIGAITKRTTERWVRFFRPQRKVDKSLR